ncbi:oligosaccharide flippase family protein [Psychrobacter sp. Ps5]|nr:oligosaccharide flippase family protein [Psychrobacter sp. Ps5]MCG3860916.1 oligosaccharide flippase family protein [Psychrobacter sp. Ps5]
MIYKIKSVFKSSLVRNASKLASGTIVAQIIAFITIPILSRTYSQEAFGLLAIFSAVVVFISSFATLKYDTALVLPKDDKDAYTLLKLSNIATLIITVICVSFMLLPIPYFKQYQGLQVLIGIGVLLSVNYNNSALWNIRYKQFNHTSISKVVQSIAIFLAQYLLYHYFELKGLIIGNVIGIFIAGIYLIINRDFDWKVYRAITKNNMREQGKRYIDFPKYFTAANAILSLSSSLPVLLFVKYIPLSQIGVYGIALRIISQPVSLIANSIRSVILADMAERKNRNKSILKWYINILLGLFVLSILASVFLILLADYIVNIFLGKEWADAALYAKMLIPLLIGMMIASPGIAAVRVFEMQKYNFKYSIVSLVLKAITLLGLFSWTNLDFEYIILIYAVVNLLLIVGSNSIILIRIRVYEQRIKSY